MAGKVSRVSMISSTAVNDNDDELIKFSQQTRIARMSRKMLEFSLAFLSIDGLQFQEERKNGSSIQLTQEPQQKHWQVRFWQIVSHPLYAYLIARSLLTFSLRFIINYLSSARISSPSAQSILEQKLRWLLDVNGDPACAVHKLTPLAYVGHPIFIILFSVALPYYIRNIQPFNCAVVRFLLDPKREIRRLNCSTREKLNSALDRVEQRRRELSSLLRTSSRFPDLYLHQMNLCDGQQLLATLEGLMAQSSLLRQFRQNLKTIRLPTFTAERLQTYYQLFLLFYAIALVIDLIVFSGIISFAIHIVWEGRCKENFLAQQRWPNDTQPSECPFASQFRLGELPLFAEICLSYQVLAALSLTTMICLINIISFDQSAMTKYMNDSLSCLLAKLRQTRRQLEQTLGRQSKQVRTDSPGSIGVESAMYENIICLWTYEEESRRNISQLGIFMTFYISLVGSLTLVSSCTYLPTITASSVGCKASDSTAEKSTDLLNRRADLFALVIPMILWTFANTLMLTSAIISSRVVQMKRLVVAILAQTIAIKHSRGLGASRGSSSLKVEASRREMEANDPLVELWRRIVLSRSFAEDHHPVKVLNFKITYGKVLEINFYVIALISLLSTRR